MIKYEELINLGFTERLISSYLQKGSLTSKNDSYWIQSTRLLNNIMRRALMKDFLIAERLFNCVDLEYQFYFFIVKGDKNEADKILKKTTIKDPLVKILNYFLYNNKEDLKNINIGSLKENNLLFLYNLLNKYVHYREKDMTLFIINKLAEKTQLDFDIFMIYKSCSLLSSTSKYIYDETDFKDTNVCHEYLINLERKILFLIEIEDYSNAINIIKELGNIYSNPISLVIIYLLIENLKNMKIYHKLLSSRDENVIKGPYYSVLLRLIKAKDYYRFKEVVDELITTSTNFSYVLEVYHVLIERILVLNEENLKNIFIELEKNCLGFNEDIKLFGKYNLSSIPLEKMNHFWLLSEMKIEDGIDYYEVYLNAYKKQDYVLAKKNLLKYITKEKRDKKNYKFDYLIKNLEILIKNNNNSKLQKEAEINNREKAKEEIKKGNIIIAIGYIQECIKCQKITNSFDLAWIGSLYYQLENYEEAIKYFNEGRKVAIKPEDFVLYLLSLMKIKKYEETIIMSNEYFNIYGEDANIVHYIKSICYLKLKEYDEAYDEILSIEAINAIYYNNYGTLAFERKVIEDNRCGKASEYTMDDYIEFGLTEEEKELHSWIKSLLSLNDSDSIYIKVILEAEKIEKIDKKLEYLLSVMKILFLEKRESEGEKIVNYINSIVKSNDFGDKKEKILRITSVYKENFLEINI